MGSCPDIYMQTLMYMCMYRMPKGMLYLRSVFLPCVLITVHNCIMYESKFNEWMDERKNGFMYMRETHLLFFEFLFIAAKTR